MARYILLCTLLGVALGWIPSLLHGPVPYRYDVLYMNGSIAVWGWYCARLLIGFLVGITTWPERWWIRGPLCGLLMILPVSLVSLATPGCGRPCMLLNHLTAWTDGTLVAGLAYLLTGRRHGRDSGPGPASEA